MQARIEDEVRKRQELSDQLEAERAERQAEREAQSHKLSVITQFLEGLGAHTGFSLPPGLLATPPPPTAHVTPVSMKVYCFRLCFACMTSIFVD